MIFFIFTSGISVQIERIISIPIFLSTDKYILVDGGAVVEIDFDRLQKIGDEIC